jgi:hypothetical protein
VGRPFGPRFAGVHRFHRPFFRHRFAFAGAPFAYASYGGCWRRTWTAWGPRWINVCRVNAAWGPGWGAGWGPGPGPVWY